MIALIAGAIAVEIAATAGLHSTEGSGARSPQWSSSSATWVFGDNMSITRHVTDPRGGGMVVLKTGIDSSGETASS